MKAWKKWNAGVKSDLKTIRQLAKKHKKLYSKYRPFKGYRRKYRNGNARERMKKKAWEFIVKNGPWLPGKAFWEMTR